jgi:hypothetical protein
MRCWVDLFGAKLRAFERLEAKLVAARLIWDNARHAMLFAQRARELGVVPEAYRLTGAGRRIFLHLETPEGPLESFAFAQGSLDHFAALLSIYREAADPATRSIIETVRADVAEHLDLLADFLNQAADTPEKRQRTERLRALADSMYTDREEEELQGYAEDHP